jgi:hypothetical protein
MAATVIQAFNEFMANTVNLDAAETKKAKGSRDWLVGQIGVFADGDSKFPEIYIEKNIFYGSFSRGTKKRPLDDIDIMICMKAAGCTYLEYTDRIEITVPDSSARFLDYVNEGTKILNSRKVINAFVGKLAKVPQYKRAEIKRNQEAATLNLDSYDWVFDIVPCFFTALEPNQRSYYLIPDGNGNWKKTDPRLDQERLSTLSNLHDGHILNVIRAIKYWNNRPTMPTISSYLIENMILDYYGALGTKATQFVDLELVKVLKDIQTRIYYPVYDPKNIQGNLNTLTVEEKNKIAQRAHDDYAKAVSARSYETEKKEKESINLWIEIFGDKFPKYE